MTMSKEKKKNEVATLDGPQVSNPYESAVVVKSEHENAVIASESQRAMIEVMTSFEVAKRFPRDPAVAAGKILRECERPTLAALGRFSFPMGGQTIEGPTIRLLEAIARAWGNVQFGFKVLSSNKQRSIVRAFAFDLESNTNANKEFEVRHWIDTKSGGRPCRDEREQNMLVANQAQRRVRSCLEALIPRDVLDMAEDKCEETNKKNVDTTPAGIKKVLSAFDALDVNKAMIEARFGGLKADAFKAPQILALRKIYASLKDGMATVEDFFDVSLQTKKEKVDSKTGEVTPTDDATKQPDLTKEVADKKETDKPKEEVKHEADDFPGDRPTKKWCKPCGGKGVVETAEGKGPCPACNGEGKV